MHFREHFGVTCRGQVNVRPNIRIVGPPPRVRIIRALIAAF
jgi:hypothetical protein